MNSTKLAVGFATIIAVLSLGFQNCGQELDLSEVESGSLAGGPVLGMYEDSIAVNVGDELILNVPATPSDLIYDWFFTPAGGSESSVQSGASPIYRVASAAAEHAGLYRVLIAKDGLTAEATITVAVTSGPRERPRLGTPTPTPPPQATPTPTPPPMLTPTPTPIPLATPTPTPICGANWLNGNTCASRTCASGTKVITPDAGVCAMSGTCMGVCAVTCQNDDYWYCQR